ncbi:neprilysin-2-like [Venturia canescens]|uniref:neprilysin-2-like n=1 Tax=Venturia canescens TaxID=32260 RepID=UPI001C9C1335|nr:neprilysin-2-like [Venturia canescens]
MEGNRSLIFALCTLFLRVTVASGEMIDTKVSEKGRTESVASSNLCLTPACIHSASRILASMNPSVRPCDDFYEFACGSYAESVSIASNRPMKDPNFEAEDAILFRLVKLIEDIDESNAPKHFRLVKTYYEQCAKDLSIWKNGVIQLNAAVNGILRGNGWPLLQMKSWNERKFGYGGAFSSLFAMSRTLDLENNTELITNIDESAPPLDRHYLREGFSNEIVQAYYQYMVDIAVGLGCNKTVAKIDFNETLSLEIELYQKVFTKNDDPDVSQRYSKPRLGELQQKYKISLSDNPESDTNSKVQLKFDEETLDRAMTWMRNKSKRALANWAAWRTLAVKIPQFPSYLSHRRWAFRRILEGTQSESCAEKTRSSLGFALSALYQRKYINQSSIDDMIVMLGNIEHEFSTLVQKAEWLDKDTRKKLVEKVSNMKNSLSVCREAIRDEELEAFYSGLDLSKDSFDETNRIIAEFNSMKPSSARNPSNRSFCGKSWLTTSYIPQFNFLQIAARSLFGFFYDGDRPKYLNYGVTSEDIAHELGHSLSPTAIIYDKDGNVKPWLDLESKKYYLNRVQCFIDQFGNYTIDGTKIRVNGYLTVNENIADYTGVKIAYYAYDKWANANSREKFLPGLDYSPKQMFWIAMANTWCAKYRPQFLKSRAYEDEHAPNKIRVNGPLANIREFSDDFQCDSSTRMNPENKCHLW